MDCNTFWIVLELPTNQPNMDPRPVIYWNSQHPSTYRLPPCTRPRWSRSMSWWPHFLSNFLRNHRHARPDKFLHPLSELERLQQANFEKRLTNGQQIRMRKIEQYHEGGMEMVRFSSTLTFCAQPLFHHNYDLGERCFIHKALPSCTC